MSELKVIDLGNIRESIENNESVYYEYYAKSEADKVIVELEEKLKNSRNSHKFWRREYLIEYKECRHHKYKRCLAMAQEWRNYAAFCCMQSHCHNHRGFGKTAEKWTWKECHAWRCVKRYKELAERFKHNNEVNNG